jgi:hypothetical protein
MGSNQVPSFKDVYVWINSDFEIESLRRDGPERGHLGWGLFFEVRSVGFFDSSLHDPYFT